MTEFPYSNIIWLTQGKYAIVDNEDYQWLSEWKWYYTGGYAKRSKRMGAEKTPRRQFPMHRAIINCPNGLLVDHKDGNRLNNTRSNLRICTYADNARNRKLGKNKSGLKGVSWCEHHQKWLAKIKVNRKCIYLGSSNCKNEASEMYKKASLKYHGEFGNF